MLGQEEPKPFIWLHSTDNSNLDLVLVDPLVFFPDYRIIPNPEDLTKLEENDLHELKICVIVTLSFDQL